MEIEYSYEEELRRFYNDKSQSVMGKRCKEIIGSGLSYKELEIVTYNILEVMREDGSLRTDRVMPTIEWQKSLIDGMNKSDKEYMDRIDQYKGLHNIKLIDVIPMNELQQSWFDYVVCVTDIIPKPIDRVLTGIIHVDHEDEESIPF